MRIRALPQHDVCLTGQLPDVVNVRDETNGFPADKVASAQNVPINAARRRVSETIQAHAVDEHGMAELPTDPVALAALQPNVELLRALKGRAGPAMTTAIRSIARQVVEDLLRRLRTTTSQALFGARRRRPSGARRSAADLDFRATIRDHLKNWNVEHQVLVAERVRFMGRTRRRFPWTAVRCVDQSGSMASSVLHAAVMAAILSPLPAVSFRLVV